MRKLFVLIISIIVFVGCSVGSRDQQWAGASVKAKESNSGVVTGTAERVVTGHNKYDIASYTPKEKLEAVADVTDNYLSLRILDSDNIDTETKAMLLLKMRDSGSEKKSESKRTAGKGEQDGYVINGSQTKTMMVVITDREDKTYLEAVIKPNDFIPHALPPGDYIFCWSFDDNPDTATMARCAMLVDSMKNDNNIVLPNKKSVSADWFMAKNR